MKIKTSSLILPAFLLVSLVMGCSEEDNPPEPLTDIEGNIYKTVQIGNQVWMAENLRTSTLADGTEIPEIPDPGDWSELASSGLCWYNNDEVANKDVYGALYNYYTANSGKICPEGWHVPSWDEWLQMRDVIGDTLTGGGKLKEEGTLHWNNPNTGALNSTGFTALPAGIRYFEGTYNSLYYFTSFWSATESDNSNAWYMSLYYSDAAVVILNTNKKDGFSIRCIKD